MATAPLIDAPVEPVVAAEIIILDPAEITIGDRLRPIDPIHAEAVGRSMMKDGQIMPIEVCQMPGRGWHLAGPGGHRLTGAKIVGMDGIEARVVSPSRTSRRRREAVENLFRRDLDPIDRAATIAELVLLKREEAGIAEAAHRAASVPGRLRREVRAEADQALETISSVYGWSEELGAELGFTGRTIRNDLLIYRALPPSLVTRLREARHPILRNATQLRGLAKLDETGQRRAVEALVAGARTLSEASRPAGANRPVDPEAKRLSTFIGTFQRMGLPEKKAALFQLAGMLPAGFALETGK